MDVDDALNSWTEVITDKTKHKIANTMPQPVVSFFKTSLVDVPKRDVPASPPKEAPSPIDLDF